MTDKSIKLDIAIGIFIILLFIGFSYKSLPLIESIERHIYDIAIKFTPKNDSQTNNIILVDIDDHSLAELGPWPWSRDLIANMINLLKQNGAKLIGLNVLFPEKENKQALLAMEALSESLDAATKARMKETLDKDLRLVESIKESENVILPIRATLGNTHKASKGRDYPVLGNNFLTSSDISPSLHEKLHADYLLLPYTEISISAMGLGHNYITRDTNMAGRSHLRSAAGSGASAVTNIKPMNYRVGRELTEPLAFGRVLVNARM